MTVLIRRSRMKSRYMREKIFWTAIAFVLACLAVPALFGEDQKRTAPNTGGHNASPPRQVHEGAPRQVHESAPRQAAPQRTAPSGGGDTHSPSTPARAPSSPSGRGTYSPSGRNQTGSG